MNEKMKQNGVNRMKRNPINDRKSRNGPKNHHIALAGGRHKPRSRESMGRRQGCVSIGMMSKPLRSVLAILFEDRVNYFTLDSIAQ